MHCNLRLPDATPVLIRFNYEAHAKFEVAQPILSYSVFTAHIVKIRYDLDL